MKLCHIVSIFFISFQVGAGVICPDLNVSNDQENIDHVLKKAKEFTDDRPNAYPKLKTQGLLSGEGIREQSINARQDFEKAEFLAFSWKLTKNPIYLNKARDILIAWSSIYLPSYNPIDETKFSNLFKSYILIKDDLNQDDRIKIDNWINIFAKGYLKDLIVNSKKKDPQFTNWQSHRIKIAFYSAVSVDNKKFINQVLYFFKQQVYRNISDTGMVYDFTTRDSIGYSVYSLTPLFETLLLINNVEPAWIKNNEDVKNRLMKGITWLKPYIMKEKFHKEFNNSFIKFDHVRYDKIIKNGDNIWNPKNSSNLIWMSTYFNKNNVILANVVSNKEPSLLELCYGKP